MGSRPRAWSIRTHSSIPFADRLDATQRQRFGRVDLESDELAGELGSLRDGQLIGTAADGALGSACSFGHGSAEL